MKPRIESAPLDKKLLVPVTHLEFTLIVYLAHLQGHAADEWVRLLLKGAVRNELHERLRQDLLGRVTGDQDDDVAVE